MPPSVLQMSGLNVLASTPLYALRCQNKRVGLQEPGQGCQRPQSQTWNTERPESTLALPQGEVRARVSVLLAS